MAESKSRNIEKMRRDTSIYRIYQHLLTHKRGITTWQAIERYKETRLSGRIYELEKHYGVPINRTQMVSKEGKRFVRYTLGEEDK